MSLTVTLRGKAGSKPRFASIAGGELICELQDRFGLQWDIKGEVRDRSDLKAAASFGGGNQTQVIMTAKIPTVLPSGEVLRAQLRVTDQDYAGKCLLITYGFLRLICTNGLMGFRSVATPTRIPHFKNRIETLTYLVDQIEASHIKFSAILAHVVALQSKAVINPIAFVEGMELPAKAKAQVIELIKTGRNRPEDDVNTAWGLYNLVNETDRLSSRRNSTAYAARDFNSPLTVIAA